MYSDDIRLGDIIVEDDDGDIVVLENYVIFYLLGYLILLRMRGRNFLNRL